MAKLSGQSRSDFQPGGCLFSQTTAIWRPPEYSSMSDKPEKQAQENKTREPLAIMHTWIVTSLM